MAEWQDSAAVVQVSRERYNELMYIERVWNEQGNGSATAWEETPEAQNILNDGGH